MTRLLSMPTESQAYSASADQGTATPNFALQPTATPTHISALQNTATASHLVTKVATLNNDIRESHVKALTQEWSIRRQQRAQTGVRELLELLADQGFAWRDIARMIGVSVPAIQKWRKGEKAAGENRLKLASLIAAQDLIASQYQIQEIESWFETPIMEGIPVTPIDMWAANETFLVLEYASGHLDPEAALSRFDPSWRETYDSGFEVFRGEDGQMSIRSKG